MKLSIVIVTYNSAAYIGACLASIERHLAGTEKEICVVDNGSKDDTRDLLARDYPRVKVLVNARNLGFAAGVNLGIHHTTGRYVLWLNPDSELLDGGIQKVMEDLERDNRNGIAGLKIIDPGGTLQLSARAFPSYETALFNRYSFLTRFFPKNPWSRKYLKTDWDHAEPSQVDWVSGAALLHKRKVWNEIGGVDEDFFMYCEDVDFCLRARQKGTRTIYHPGAKVMHRIGGSSRFARKRMIIAHHRSMWLFYKKHFKRNFIKDWLVGAGVCLRCVLGLLGLTGRKEKK